VSEENYLTCVFSTVIHMPLQPAYAEKWKIAIQISQTKQFTAILSMKVVWKSQPLDI